MLSDGFIVLFIVLTASANRPLSKCVDVSVCFSMALLFCCIWAALESGSRGQLGSYKSIPGPLMWKNWPGQDQTPIWAGTYSTNVNIIQQPQKPGQAGRRPASSAKWTVGVLFLCVDTL